MSLQQAAGALQDISDAMDVSAASPLPVYALTHPLGLPHNTVPFVSQTPQALPLQVAATTVATTLTHTSSSQISGRGGGSGGGGGGGVLGSSWPSARLVWFASLF